MPHNHITGADSCWSRFCTLEDSHSGTSQENCGKVECNSLGRESLLQNDVGNWANPKLVWWIGEDIKNFHGLQPMDLVKPSVAKVGIPQFLNVVQFHGARSIAFRVRQVMDIPYLDLHYRARFPVADCGQLFKDVGQVDAPCRSGCLSRLLMSLLHLESSGEDRWGDLLAG